MLQENILVWYLCNILEICWNQWLEDVQIAVIPQFPLQLQLQATINEKKKSVLFGLRLSLVRSASEESMNVMQLQIW